jgi:DNA-binding NtrC family response regulator
MARILVVDDEASVREVLRDLLTDAGHQVVEAVDGEDALRRFRVASTDLVITDILMPNAGGLNLLGALSQKAPALPMIAISGGGKDGKLNFLSTAATFPTVRTLKKPFHVTDLLGLVQESLAAAP